MVRLVSARHYWVMAGGCVGCTFVISVGIELTKVHTDSIRRGSHQPVSHRLAAIHESASGRHQRNLVKLPHRRTSKVERATRRMAGQRRGDILQFETADAAVDLFHPDVDRIRSRVREKLFEVL